MADSSGDGELRGRLQAALGADRYTIERELGAGGMSRVFLATELALRRHVVVKVLPPDLAAALSAGRFRREMLLAAQLQHPHIVPVLSAGDSGELLYFVMPYVEGESLRRRLGAPLPLEEVTRILRDVASALAFAHKRGIVHRDIKPENILVADDAAMVTDFGVAKALSAAGAGTGTLTGVGLALGTPAYMAPEQALADPALDHRADLYALGVVAYEMLVGAPPFQRATAQALIAAHLTESPTPVTSRRAGVPPAICDLVTSLLAKDPAQRPQSAEDVLAVLQQSATLPESVSTRARIRVAGVVALVVIAGMAGYFTLLARRAPARTTAEAATVALAPGASRSIAVLPFVNLSAERDNEFFSDGMTEELIDVLANIDGLHVAARTSSFALKGVKGDVRDIAKRLGVSALLEGSVRREGKMVRVAADLVNASDGQTIWSHTYQREVSGVFAMQDSIAHAIADAMRLTLAAGARRATESAEAYDLYLRGRYFWNTRRNAAELQRAIDYFGQALAIDSGYARAYSGLADAYSLLAIFGGVRPDSVYPLARVAALKAISLDSTLAEAQTSLGIVSLLYEWDFAKTARVLDRAIALNPNYPSAHLFRGWQLSVTGQIDSSVVEIRRAQQLDPLNLIINARVGTILLWARRNDEARAHLERAMKLDSTYAMMRSQLALVDALQGRTREAIALHPPALQVSTSIEGGALGYIYALAGEREKAMGVARELEQLAAHRYVPPDAIAAVFAGLGERDSAFVWLDRAVRQRTSTIIFMRLEPMFDSLRSDPRFEQIAKRVGLMSTQPR